MEKAKLILSALSMIFVLACLSGCIWMVCGLPSTDSNYGFFQTMTFVFAAASIWFARNLYAAIKEYNA